MKRVAPILALTAALAMLLTGCGGNAEPETPPTADTAPAVQINGQAVTAVPVETAQRLTLLDEWENLDTAADPFTLPLTITITWGEDAPNNRKVSLEPYRPDDEKGVVAFATALAQEDTDTGTTTFSIVKMADAAIEVNREVVCGFVLCRSDTGERWVIATKAYNNTQIYDPPVAMPAGDYDGQEYYSRYSNTLENIEWVMMKTDTAVFDAFDAARNAIPDPTDGELNANRQSLAALACIENGTLTEATLRTADKADDVILLSDADIAVLFSGDRAAIDRHFRSPYALYANGKLYSAYWLATHSAEQYAAENLPLAELEALYTFYQSEAATEMGPTRRAAFEMILNAYRSLCEG